MAKDNNLQDFLTDIADAIREKKGTTEKINPQDFATEIANLSSGGGSGSGSESSISSWRYFDISNSTSDSSLMSMLISNYSHTVKVRESDGYYLLQSGYFFFAYGPSNIKDYVIAIAVDTMAYTRMDAESGVTTIDEYFKLQGRTIDEIFSEYGFSEISKEQFISL